MNLEHENSNAIRDQTGNLSGMTQLPGGWETSQVISLYDSIQTCGESLLILALQSLFRGDVEFIGAQLALEKVPKRGKRPDQELILKIHAQSFGVAIRAKRMWSSMNFEDKSGFLISCGGLTSFRCSWRSKAPLRLCLPNLFGLPATWILYDGTLT